MVVSTRDYAGFLRGISNVPMQPLRAALERIGFAEVSSFGSSGNVIFSAPGLDRASIEPRVEAAVGSEAIVLTRSELDAVVAGDPYAGREGAAVFLAKHPIERAHADALLRGGFEGDPPVVVGSAVYFVHPTRRPGRRAVVDFEHELSVRGTMRGSNVLARVFQRM